MRRHHEALSDAEACYHIFARMCKTEKVKPPSQWRTYNFDVGNENIVTRSEELAAREDKARKVIDRLPEVVERSAGGVDIENSVFCLTGDFLMSPESKQPVIDMLVAQGGIYSKNLTLKCDYLIVGSLGSQFWKNGNYGSKIEKAIKYAESGKSSVRIIDEASISDLEGSFDF
jgi:NAD-dependent DNA ligase